MLGRSSVDIEGRRYIRVARTARQATAPALPTKERRRDGRAVIGVPDRSCAGRRFLVVTFACESVVQLRW